MLLTIPVPGAALITYSTRPKKKSKLVRKVGESYLFSKLNAAPVEPKVTFSSVASVQSEGTSFIEVKSML